MILPHLKLIGGYWCIYPSGRTSKHNGIIASKTFSGAASLARQCYNPKRGW